MYLDFKQVLLIGAWEVKHEIMTDRQTDIGGNREPSLPKAFNASTNCAYYSSCFKPGWFRIVKKSLGPFFPGIIRMIREKVLHCQMVCVYTRRFWYYHDEVG